MAQYETFKQHLIRQITTEDFADIYAETIAYGMFAARLNEPRAKEFSRQQALRRLPESNPFLRKLFGFIAGENLDERVSWVIDDLAEVFGACDMAKLMVGFGEIRGQTDPFIHFYEDFLKIYNPKKKKLRGVWYTPEAVVNFIVRAVDDVLKTEFHLPRGLADTSKIPVSRKTGKKDLRGREITKSEEMHRVQILDPAVGHRHVFGRGDQTNCTQSQKNSSRNVVGIHRKRTHPQAARFRVPHGVLRHVPCQT